MVSMISEEGHTKVGIYEYVIDTAAELTDVPTDVHVGSIVYCIENSKKYMLNNSGIYVEVNFKKGGSGGEARLGNKNINENGVYRASEFDLDGWSQVNVDVQPIGTIEITENGTYDVAQYASADVNVSGGGGDDSTLVDLIERDVTSINIPNGVTQIGMSAFQNCSNLTSVNIPSSVTYIGQYAFQNCSNLTSINIPSSVTSMDKNAFYGCSRLANINIPSGVTSIADSLFSDCTRLASIDIPSGVTSIGQFAFQNCLALTSVTVRAITPPSLARYSFNSAANCPIYVPAESVEAYKAASNWSSRAAYIQAIQE